MPSSPTGSPDPARPSLLTVARAWGRIGVLGFGGPPAHIRMLRDEVVVRRRWVAAEDLEDAIAACALLPGPASTQLAIWSGWRVRGPLGGLVGGLAFVLPGLVLVLALAALFLSDPPRVVAGTAAGAGAAVAAVAVQAARDLVVPSRRRAVSRRRWSAYLVVGAVVGALAGGWVVLALVVCGAYELVRGRSGSSLLSALVLPTLPALTGTAAVVWVALKVGLLSYGGGFVIIPLMQHDAVERHHWMTGGEFLNAVALGQITPGPVVHTVAVVGYAAGGTSAALLAAAVAFTPSFVMVLAGAGRFDALRRNASTQAFLLGAGPAVIGAIAGSAVPLALALGERWQVVPLAGATVLLLALRRSAVLVLLLAGAVGAVGASLGLPLPH